MSPRCFLIRTVSLLLIAVAVTSAKRYVEKPRRCCTPSQWEADIKNIGTTTRTRDPDGKLAAKLSYDYKNRRWAAQMTDASNRHNNRRVVFDHKQDTKFLITSKGCYNTSNNMAKMDRYCIPANATYLSSYDYGLGAGLNPKYIGYELWTYDMLLTPVRVVLKMSRPECMVLQDTSFSLYRNSWKWNDGEGMCVPWQFPEEAYNGECFRSHVSHSAHMGGARASGPLYNMDFRNVNLTISDEEIYRIPAKCEQVHDWPSEVEWNFFWKFLFMRMHLN